MCILAGVERPVGLAGSAVRPGGAEGERDEEEQRDAHEARGQCHGRAAKQDRSGAREGDRNKGGGGFRRNKRGKGRALRRGQTDRGEICSASASLLVFAVSGAIPMDFSWKWEGIWLLRQTGRERGTDSPPLPLPDRKSVV